MLEDPLNEEDNLPDIEDLNIPELDEVNKLVAPFSQILDAIANRFKKEAIKCIKVIQRKLTNIYQ